MYSNYNIKFRNNVVTIFVGEYYATNKVEIISTLLGSCVSVCLMDISNKVFGMNHFLLPGSTQDVEDVNGLDEPAKYGMYSMELLIKSMKKMGADERNLKAKMFGGGKIIESVPGVITVNDDNVNFARSFLNSNGISILSEDVGGVSGRRIYFNTNDGTVYVEKVRKTM